MKAITSHLEKFGSNFLVSAMVPSFAFVVASALMFDTILHITAFKNNEATPKVFSVELIVIVLTVIIGFTLTALNTYILKIFEGYIIFPPLRFLYNRTLRIHRRKARSLMADRESLEREYDRLEKSSRHDTALDERREEILNEHHRVASEYDENYPAHLDDVLPTQFGNLLRAAEDHAVQRYGFDGVTFWPRLIHVIPDNYKAVIDSTRNELSFLVNLSILSAIFTFLCVLAIFDVMWTTVAVSGNTATFAAFVGGTLKYLLAAALGTVVCGFFYNASIISLGSFTLAIRASFDLFRLDLLKKLELVRPNDFDEEFDTWENLNQLIVLGNQSLTFQPFRYREEESKT